MQIVECSGSFLAMGQQYGEQAKDLIRSNIDNRKTHYPDKYRDTAARIKALLAEKLPDCLEEMTGIAQGAAVDLLDVIMENHVTEGIEECTPVGLKSSPQGPIVSKNNDGKDPDLFPFIIRKAKPEKGIPLVQVTYAGWLSGLDAMNAEGLANTHGSVGSVFKKTGRRVDIRLKAYQLMLQCRTFQAFTEGLMNASMTGKGFSIIAGDRQGKIGVIEAAVPLVELRDVDKPFTYSTNIYMNEALKNSDRRKADRLPLCHYRFGYLLWREQNQPPANLADIKSVLSSHDPWAPCRHKGYSETLWSMICLPKSGKVLVADGQPCENEYLEVEVG